MANKHVGPGNDMFLKVNVLLLDDKIGSEARSKICVSYIAQNQDAVKVVTEIGANMLTRAHYLFCYIKVFCITLNLLLAGKILMIKWRYEKYVEEHKKKPKAAVLTAAYADINWRLTNSWFSRYVSVKVFLGLFFRDYQKHCLLLSKIFLIGAYTSSRSSENSLSWKRPAFDCPINMVFLCLRR